MTDRVVAIVLTFNRRERLAGVLRAIADQTRPVDEVLVVDNHSTDGTFEHLISLPEFAALPARVIRLARNGGSAEGYHVALHECLNGDCDWAWFVEDDLVPEPSALEALLSSQVASDLETVALASSIYAEDGGHLLVPRGTVRARWSGTPCIPIPESQYERDAVPLEYFGFLGTLARLSAVRESGLPRRDFLGWIDDVDFSWRLSQTGPAYLIPASRILHDDGSPSTDFGSNLSDRLRRFTQEPEFSTMWRNAYGLRNLIIWGRSAGVVRAPHAFVYWAILSLRALLFAPDHRFTRARIYTQMARDGWSGRVENTSPLDWTSVALDRSNGRTGQPINYSAAPDELIESDESSVLQR